MTSCGGSVCDERPQVPDVTFAQEDPHVFTETELSHDVFAIAPDGSDVRRLALVNRGSMAHFALAAGACSVATRHRTIEEMWFFTAGRGQMWRKQGPVERIVEVHAGMAI